MMGCYLVLTLFIFVVDGVVGEASGFQVVSVMEGDSVTLSTDVIKQPHDKMLWYVNDTLIALINGDPSTSCLYDGEGGRFRDRLTVDNETASLTITNIMTEHAGRFEANFIQIRSSGTSQSLNQNRKCNSTKIIEKKSRIGDTIKTFTVSVSASGSSPHKTNDESSNNVESGESDMKSVLTAACIAGVVVLMFSVTVCVIFYRRRISKNADVDKKNLEHLLGVKV